MTGPQDLTVREAGTLAPFTLTPTTLTEAMEYAKLISSSALCPADYRGKPGDVLIAVQMGLEIAGCSPLQALQNIAVINGRPTMWGDMVLAVVRRSGQLADMQERDPQECLEKGEGSCTLVRKGDSSATTRTFTMAMAEKAGLIKRSGTTGTWATHPGRMLQMRARSWALRDVFPDILKGMQVREEVEDYGPELETRRVSMPARLEAPGQVDDFIRETAPAAGSSGTSTSTAQPAAGEQEWIGHIEDVASKEKVGNDKKPYTLYHVKGADGTVFSTFSETEGKAAEAFKESAEEVRITFTMSRDNKYKNLKSISPAETVPA